MFRKISRRRNAHHLAKKPVDVRRHRRMLAAENGSERLLVMVGFAAIIDIITKQLLRARFDQVGLGQLAQDVERLVVMRGGNEHGKFLIKGHFCRTAPCFIVHFTEFTQGARRFFVRQKGQLFAQGTEQRLMHGRNAFAQQIDLREQFRFFPTQLLQLRALGGEALLELPTDMLGGIGEHAERTR